MFSAAPVNCLFIHGSNNSDSVVFHNEGFGDIKDHSFRATPFQKKNLLRKFWVYIKKTAP